ncbi:Cytochrome oxidase biogeneis protein Sco1/SenC/PrrC, putative copper metallochaperone [Candidatus Paraburkholderia kirkii]|nr:Cytochrome oxidase biogeneis protein Sco1/SenC/PrrC, putative copper metallochaperone [Candidatus Paraburkholderia kirkii]
MSDHLPDLDFSLVDDDGGARVTGRSFEGRTTLVYFGYTHCPNVCPETMARLMQVLQRVGPDTDRARILFISVDPARDTPALLRSYVHAFDDRHAVGLTGTDRAIESVAQRYRVAYQMEKRDPDGAYEVTHSSAVYIFDADGHAPARHRSRFRRRHRGRSEARDPREGRLTMSTLLYWLDPWERSLTVVIAVLVAGILFTRGAWHVRVSMSRRIAFWVGLSALYVALHTRLDYFFEHEFFMHRLQQLVLHHLGPFLIALSYPGTALREGVPFAWRQRWLRPAAQTRLARALRHRLQPGDRGRAVRRADLPLAALADPLQGDARLPAGSIA